MRKIIQKYPRTLLTFSVALYATFSAAHPNKDVYDINTAIEINGKVVGYELKNPRSILYVDVTNADGTVTSWAVEGGGAKGLAEAGLSRKFLSSGPIVKIKAYQSIDKQCTPICKAAGEDFDFDKSEWKEN